MLCVMFLRCYFIIGEYVMFFTIGGQMYCLFVEYENKM